MTPKYTRLKTALIDDISNDKYQPGDQLPSESELMKLWNMSRITVRHALSELATDGYSYTIHGKGSYVAEPKISNRLPNLTSFSYDVLQQGREPLRKVLELEIIGADTIIASKLKQAPGSQIIYFNRLMYANNIPVSVSDTYVPLSAVTPFQDKFMDGISNNQSFYSLLNELGCKLSGGEQIISSKCATSDEAKHLNIDKRTPLIYAERIAYNSEKGIIEFSIMLSRPDQIQWRVNLSSPNFGNK